MQMKQIYLRYSLLSILALIAVGGVFSPPPSVRATTATGLHVSGNQLLDSANNVFRPLGVNRAGTEYMCDAAADKTVLDGPSDAASVSAMARWNINAVRVPLNEDCWLGINGYPAAQYTAMQYEQAIIDYVNLLNANNLVAILDLHWSAPGSTRSNKQLAMPDLDHAPAFWASVAATFKGNSAVIFDLYNEPFTPSWSCWLNGSTAPSASPCNDVNFAVAGMQTLVNTVRDAGATNPIMLGGLAYANDLSQWLQNEPADPSHNLIASFHLYNFNPCNSANCWDAQVGQVAAQVPVIASEMGEKDCAHSFIDGAMNWFDQHNIGYLGWTWNTHSCSSFPSLISSYDGTPTAYGEGLKNHLAYLASINVPSPAISITSPVTGAAFTAPATVPLTVSATANNGKTITKVEFYNGSTLLGTATTSPFSFSWTDVAAGNYTLTAKAYDSSGASTVSAPIAISVNGLPGGGLACKVQYTSLDPWATDAMASITITNTGTSTINGWTLTFTLPGNQQIMQVWNGRFSQQGEQVTIKDDGYNATIVPGDSTSFGFNTTIASDDDSTSFGFNGSYSITNSTPTMFFLNGQACSPG